MKTVFVGLRNGQKALNIPYIIVMVLAVPSMLAAMLSVAFYSAAGSINGPVAAYGAVTGLGIVMVGILSGMATKEDKLKDLD